MPGLQEDDATKEEKLKAALWLSIGQMVDSAALSQDLNASAKFIGGLSELVWAQIETVAQDLESFAKHADRKIISTKDVVLLGRRNDGLKGLLENEAKHASASGPRRGS
jgi:centromere protein S